ncbi:unnamed protein product [Dovyalis caffra]|uniref:Uncharacterized protein n=1 Tax=Dovyalis caffra TaxID=77055 RepID=A0AAV1R130_9ROSI|nr:unnamed protein product [Dovyalis caffra]
MPRSYMLSLCSMQLQGLVDMNVFGDRKSGLMNPEGQKKAFCRLSKLRWAGSGARTEMAYAV